MNFQIEHDFVWRFLMRCTDWLRGMPFTPVPKKKDGTLDKRYRVGCLATCVSLFLTYCFWVWLGALWFTYFCVWIWAYPLFLILRWAWRKLYPILFRKARKLAEDVKEGWEYKG